MDGEGRQSESGLRGGCVRRAAEVLFRGFVAPLTAEGKLRQNTPVASFVTFKQLASFVDACLCLNF